MADDMSSPGSAVDNETPVNATNGTGLSDKEEQTEQTPVPDEDDDEDDDMPSKRRGKVGSTAVDDNVDGEDEDGPDDLFGDVEEDEEPVEKRQLDDEELDSGDDEGRNDRAADGEDGVAEYETMEQQIVTMDVEIPRHSLPEPSDGEMYLLKVPQFLSVEPKAWDFTKFQPPTTDHHSKLKSSDNFSAYNTALTTVRWRRSPDDPAELQSNARINRWSDGSLTLQLASDPTTQYEIDGNSLAPPQRNPLKPTPVSIRGGSKGGRQGMLFPDERYDQTKDAFTYLSAPLVDAEALRIVHKITAGLTVKQSGLAEDDALEKLQKSLAEAANATKVNGSSSIELAQLTEDPELGRKRAEVAEREKDRARKRREAAEERNSNRTGRVLGRHGLSSSRYGDGGLTIGGLEDDELGTTAGRNRTTGKGSRRPRQRRNSEYSDEEENGRKAFRATQEDYEVDDFVADDDDEEEVIDDDDEEEEELLDDPRERQRSPKRSAADDEDEDAEGEPDDEVSAPKAKRQRKIVDEDDEDDE